ncbi:type VI secretion system-associated FHA domain protein TagH [Sulfurimonas sp.]|uniref:type VI secretion system-associated FHA domain protein TagH n=1 Tax=Sulfurimonas sp. TaxID=2022749 RepID=UPI002B4996E2|nr:type VI secretion system-associated FHA domain protein TagH [Sulfurimonas sp.]
MKLVLDIVKNGKNIPAKRNFHFEEEGGSIGRMEENDWVLTDQNSYISGVHAHIICKHGSYFIKDESTNGTFLKNPYKKLPKGHPVKINASDVFIIGDHELQARYTNNDYSENDIISPFVETSESSNVIEAFEEANISDDIIPNEDFLFASSSNSFIPADEENPSDTDVISIIEDIPSSVASEDISMSDFINVSVPEPVEAVIETKEEIFEEHITVPSYTKSKVKPTPTKKVSIEVDAGLATSVAILEAKLGININNLEQEERDLLMADIGDVINNTLDSLQNSLQLKDKTKQDLQLSTSHLDVDNNPVKLGSAAAKLLQNNEQGSRLGMMKVSDAITKSFNEIDSHCIALHSSSKNVINIAMAKFSPKNLEHRFELTGALRGVLPKQQLCWKAYNEMFNTLKEHPEDGVEMIREDFKKEYENISYSLKLRTVSTRQGI